MWCVVCEVPRAFVYVCERERELVAVCVSWRGVRACAGSGKTHTMEGPPPGQDPSGVGGAGRLAQEEQEQEEQGEAAGLIPRAIADVFGHIQAATAAMGGAAAVADRSLKFLVRAR